MFSFRERCYFTVKEIGYSESYDENILLFNKGIDILNQRERSDDDSEFTDEEREILEEIFTIIELEKR